MKGGPSPGGASCGVIWTRRLSPFLWMAVIYLLSTDNMSFPEVRRTWAGFLGAKAAHFGEYFVLAVLWHRFIDWRPGRVFLKAAALSFVLSALYAPLDELHQGFTAERAASFTDVVLDWSGAALGAASPWVSPRLEIMFKRLSARGF